MGSFGNPTAMPLLPTATRTGANRSSRPRSASSRSTSLIRIGGRRYRSAAADRSDHVDARARVEARVEPRTLAVDVHVDVGPQHLPLLAEPVAQPRPALVEAHVRLPHAGRLHVKAARQVVKQG